MNKLWVFFLLPLLTACESGPLPPVVKGRVTSRVSLTQTFPGDVFFLFTLETANGNTLSFKTHRLINPGETVCVQPGREPEDFSHIVECPEGLK